MTGSDPELTRKMLREVDEMQAWFLINVNSSFISLKHLQLGTEEKFSVQSDVHFAWKSIHLLFDEGEEHEHEEENRRNSGACGAAGLLHLAIVFLVDFFEFAFMHFPWVITVALDSFKILKKTKFLPPRSTSIFNASHAASWSWLWASLVAFLWPSLSYGHGHSSWLHPIAFTLSIQSSRFPSITPSQSA